MNVQSGAAQVGIALVGMSSLLSGEGSAQVDVSPEKMLLGMGLIVASQVCLHSHASPSSTDSYMVEQTKFPVTCNLTGLGMGHLMYVVIRTGLSL